MSATTVTDPSAFTEGSFAIKLVLSIVTLGLYGFYWLYQINSQLAAGTDAEFDPAMRTVITIVGSLFLVGLYWFYLTCKDAESITDQSGGLLFVLTLIPFAGLLTMYWIQSGINEAARSA